MKPSAPAAETVTFGFDGKSIHARTGDSLAAALAANGITQIRKTVQGADRGIFCGMGVCNECLVVVDGARSQRACMTHARDGLQVESQDDRVLDKAPTQPPLLPETTHTTDVLIVGAGPAGLSAAITCRDHGATVLMVDERDAAGGQYFKARTGNSRHPGAEDAQHRAGHALRAQADGLLILSEQTAWYARRLGDGSFDLRTTGPQGRHRITAKAMTIAAGAYELPSIVPGWTLPGVMTIGAGQTLVRRYGVAPGARTLIAGNGPLGLQLGYELASIGATVSAIAERSTLRAEPAMLRAAMADPALFARGAGYHIRLRQRGVPILTGWEVAEVTQDGPQLAVHLARIGRSDRKVIEADALCIGNGFAPQVELARLLGCAVTLVDGVPVPQRGRDCATEVPGLWIAGDAGGLGGAQLALAQGRVAASGALRHLGKTVAPAPVLTRRIARIEKFQSALWQIYAAPAAPPPARQDDLILCRCESVSAAAVSAAIEAGATDPGAIKRATRLGMGRCQGRYCLRPAVRLLQEEGHEVSAEQLFAPQLPARPLAIHGLSVEKPEWAGHRESSPTARPAARDAQPLAAERADVVVIGAGVTGLSAALFAARSGAKVICVDRGRIGAEASGGNAGSLHLQLLSWDFGSKAFAGGSAALRTLPLRAQSIQLWRDREQELAADFEMKVTGGLMVAENPAQIDFLKQKAAAEASVGIHTVVLGAEEIRAIIPQISDRIVAGAWCPGEGKINPLPATAALARAARAAGAVIEEMAGVDGITRDGSDYLVETSRGTVRAPRLILAAGGWSAALGRFLGVDLPIRGAPLQMLVTEPAPPLIPCLVAHADRHLTMKQASCGTVIIGGAWTAETGPTGQARVLADSIEGNLWVAGHTVPAVGRLSLIRSWAAMNIDIDGAPLLSALPGYPGVVIAATANGFTLGPLMGREAAALALTGMPVPDLSPFTLDRF